MSVIEQRSIFDSLSDTYELQWREFIAHRPEVWGEIVRIVAMAKDRGEQRISIKLVFELIRRTVPREGRPVALNNNWSSVAARQLIEQRPDLAPLLKTRQRKS